ncbi:MAG: HlyD family efflux transporter periplasmic adaptor subunit [Mariprofundaceae bacterium]|nr:HlyD family efflux transporter periplasmic adaptor subunit [Mariprofundaceae bacterium]
MRRSGEPTWSIYDPVRNSYFRIGWQEFEILSRWYLMDAQAIVDAVSMQTSLNPVLAHVEQLSLFLRRNNLIQVAGAEGVAYLTSQVKAGRTHWFKWLLKNYLFVRVPLIQPNQLLDRTKHFLDWFFTPAFLYVLIFSAFLGSYLVSRQWDAFMHTFMHFFTLEGFFYYGCALFFAKIIHEFGHAYVAKYYGVHVPTMGLALLVMWPVLYTDTSDAWKLSSKKKRMHIGAAGMAAELSLALLATLLWCIAPEGMLRSTFFLLATTTWVMTLAINLNPFMRFDGYYLLSDWWEVENLQQRGFALGRWKLREILFDVGERVPEYFRPTLHVRLIVYAWSTWLYRFFLFLGIAFLVYFFFFKILGILLMLVELGWFILLPIYNEMKEWWKHKEKMNSFATYRTVTVFIVLLAAFVMPWQTNVFAPALWLSQHQMTLYAPEAAVVTHIAVKEGDRVEKNQLLMKLSSSALTHKLEMLQQQIELSKWQHETQGVSLLLAEESRVLSQEFQGLMTEYHTLQERESSLHVRADFDGQLVYVNIDVKKSSYVQKNEALMLVVDPNSAIVHAYVFEEDLSQVTGLDHAIFYPENTSESPIPLHFESIDQADSAILDEKILASVYQGKIPVVQNKKGDLVPETAIYKVSFRCAQPQFIQHRLRGVVRIEGERRSYLSRVFDQVVAVLVRESGF